MKIIPTILMILLFVPPVAAFPIVSQQGSFVTIRNDTTTGTTLNTLTTLTSSSPATAVVASAGAVSGIVGITVGGAGKTTAALIQQSGQTNCQFDGPTTAAHLVVSSTSIPGDCHDSGSASPNSAAVGIVTTTNSAAGLYTVILGVNTGGLSALQPLNLLPSQTANYNGSGFDISNETIGKITPAAGAFTNLTGNGAISITGTGTAGTDSVSHVNVNGIVNVLTYGVTCDGATDNTTALQAALNAACPGTQTGVVQIPASCYGASGHQLVFNSTITIPTQCAIKGLGGNPVAGGGTRAVELDYGGSGTAMTTSTAAAANGVRLQNFRLKNTGTGTNGIFLSGAFHSVIDSVLVDGGFSGAGFVFANNSSASSNTDYVVNSASYQNGYGIEFDGTQASASTNVSTISLINDDFITSTIDNVFINGHTGATLNVNSLFFYGDNIAEGTITNIQCTNAHNISLYGGFIENVTSLYSLSNCFDFFSRGVNVSSTGLTGPPIVADGVSTYDVGSNAAGNVGSQYLGNIPYIPAYVEPAAVQDQTGQVGFGQLTNDIKDSEDLSTANWAVDATITSRTPAAATAPNGTTTATQVVRGSGGQVRQGYATGGALTSTCWQGSVWAQAASSVIPSYGIKIGDGTNFQVTNYYLTTTWQRLLVHYCFPNPDSATTVTFYPVAASNPSVITVNLWGAQLSPVQANTRVTGPIPYVRTAGTAQTSTSVGLTAPLITAYPTVTSQNGTSGTASCSMAMQGTLKVSTCYLNAYANTSTAQTYSYPTAFSTTPILLESGGSCGTYNPTTTSSTLTLPANAGMSTETCNIIAEGQ
jgi:hypothetical protein